MSQPHPAKQAAVEQWTADPCEAHNADGAPGTARYLANLLAARDDYASWMPDALGYRTAQGKRVLDLGCGQGIDLIRFAQAGAQVTGIDLTPRHVELAREHLALLGIHADVVSGDSEELPFGDKAFDRVCSNGALHHTPDLPAALAEARRVLRSKGDARIILYNRASLHYWLNQVGYEGLWRRRLLTEGSMAGVLSLGVEYSGGGGRPLVNVYTPRQARRLLSEAGFREVSTEVRQFKPGDAWPYGLLAKGLRSLRSPRVLDRVGRKAGWYVVARGVR